MRSHGVGEDELLLAYCVLVGAISDSRCCLRGGGLRAGVLPGFFRGWCISIILIPSVASVISVLLSSVEIEVVVIGGGRGINATIFSSSSVESRTEPSSTNRITVSSCLEDFDGVVK